MSGSRLPLDDGDPKTDSTFKQRQSRRDVISWASVWRVIAAVLATLAALWALNQMRSLVAMIVISVFLSLALEPGVRWLRDRYGWSRGSAVGVIYLAGITFVVVMAGVLVPSIVEFAERIGTQGPEWVSSLNDWTNESFGFELLNQSQAAATPQDVQSFVEDWASSGFGGLTGIASAGATFVFSLGTIAMFTFYFTADATRLQRSVLSLVSPKNQYRVGWTWDQAVIQTGGYFYSRILLMLINGFGFFVTMVIVGVPVTISIPLALIGAFIAAFIPAIGTYIGSALPIVVTLGLSGVIPALIVLGYAIVYQQIENYWLSPKISAKTMTLNGAVAFGSALAGGAIAGPLGAFVALPVAALITSLISNFVTHYEVIYKFTDDNTVADDTSSERDSTELVP